MAIPSSADPDERTTTVAVTPKAPSVFKADDKSAVQILMPGRAFDETNPAALKTGSNFQRIPERPYPTAS